MMFKNNWLKIGLAILFVLVILTNTNVNEVFSIVKHVDVTEICMAILIVLLTKLLMSARWKLIVDSHFMPISYAESIYIILVSGTAGFFSPGGVAADFLKGYHVYKKDKNLSKVTSIVVIDKLIGILSMLILISIVSSYLLFSHYQGGSDMLKPVAFISSLIVLSVFFGVLILIRFEEKIAKFASNLPVKMRKMFGTINSVFKGITLNKTLMMQAFGLSLFMQILRSLIFYFILSSLSIDVNFIYVMIYFPIVFMLTLLPVTFGGVGVREGATFVLFEQFGVNWEYSIVSGLIFYAMQLLMAVLGMIVHVIFSERIKQVSHP